MTDTMAVTDYNRYYIVDEVTMSRLLQVVEFAELMAKEHYTHLIDDINFAKTCFANNAKEFTGTQNVPSVAREAQLYTELKKR